MPGGAEKKVFSPPIRITLVAPPFEQDEPDQYDQLAQANLDGEPALSAQFISPVQLLQQTEQNKNQVEGSQSASQLLANNNSNTGLQQNQNRKQQQQPDEPLQDRESLTRLINQSYINNDLETRHKFIGGRAREHKFAAYMEHWRQSVERIGNLNYPEAAKIQKLQGDLVLDVMISSDGSIADIELLRSSGLKVLDDAAIRTVHLAAPFQPFPDSFKHEFDQLHIVRTWEYQYNKVTASSPSRL